MPNVPVPAVAQEPLVALDPGGEAPPCLTPDRLGTDLQKYKWDRNRTLPGTACKSGADSPISPLFRFKLAATCTSATGVNPCTRVSHRSRPRQGPRRGDLAAQCEADQPHRAGGRLPVSAAETDLQVNDILGGCGRVRRRRRRWRRRTPPTRLAPRGVVYNRRSRCAIATASATQGEQRRV